MAAAPGIHEPLRRQLTPRRREVTAATPHGGPAATEHAVGLDALGQAGHLDRPGPRRDSSGSTPARSGRRRGRHAQRVERRGIDAGKVGDARRPMALRRQQDQRAGDVSSRRAPTRIEPVDDHRTALGEDHVAGMEIAVAHRRCVDRRAARRAPTAARRRGEPRRRGSCSSVGRRGAAAPPAGARGRTGPPEAGQRRCMVGDGRRPAAQVLPHRPATDALVDADRSSVEPLDTEQPRHRGTDRETASA